MEFNSKDLLLEIVLYAKLGGPSLIFSKIHTFWSLSSQVLACLSHMAWDEYPFEFQLSIVVVCLEHHSIWFHFAPANHTYQKRVLIPDFDKSPQLCSPKIWNSMKNAYISRNTYGVIQKNNSTRAFISNLHESEQTLAQTFSTILMQTFIAITL